MMRAMRMCFVSVGLLLGLQALWMLVPQRAFGLGGCVPTPGVCHVSGAAPCGGAIAGTDDCGGPCTVAGKSAGACVSDAFIACGQQGIGYNACGKPCTVYGKRPGACVPLMGPIACGKQGPGQDNCGNPCQAAGPVCSSRLVPYGFTVPGDKDYGFPNATGPEVPLGAISVGGGSVTVGGTPVIPDPDATDFLGLAAKGNVVIGDYTSDAFRTNALPNLKPGAKSKTQPYVIDPTDAALGYLTGVGGTMYNEQGLPLFDGNYDQKDGGDKLDATERKLYESSLSDADFQSQMNMSRGGHVIVDAVLFTNHALAGFVPGDLTVNGAMVSRDDGLVYSGTMTVNHDIRLLTGKTVEQSVLPVTIKRPKVVSWKDCSVSQCDD